jgi:hypothetical protein
VSMPWASNASMVASAVVIFGIQALPLVRERSCLQIEPCLSRYVRRASLGEHAGGR